MRASSLIDCVRALCTGAHSFSHACVPCHLRASLSSRCVCDSYACLCLSVFAVIRADWQVSHCEIRRLVNTRPLYDPRLPLQHRCSTVTYDGQPDLSPSTSSSAAGGAAGGGGKGGKGGKGGNGGKGGKGLGESVVEAPLAGALFPARVQEMCGLIARHIHRVTQGQLRVAKMRLYFKIGESARVDV